MRHFSFFLILVFSFSNAYANDLSQFEGCYDTLLIDNQTPAKGPDLSRSFTEITLNESTVFRDIEKKKPLDVLVMTFFTGYSEPWYGYHSFILFKDLGHWDITKNKVSYDVDQDVYMENWGRLKKTDHFLNLDLEINQDILEGKIHFSSSIRQLSYERSFRLRKIKCFTGK